MKREEIVLKTENHQSRAILFHPANPKNHGVILAHGAGNNMDSPFMTYFHSQLAEAGYPCLKFNFFYMNAGKRTPDPQPLLTACYRKAMDAMSVNNLIIGGKSMGGRMASYISDDSRVSGLLFLGYPLHPPGKIDSLRDQHLYQIHKPMLFVSGSKDPFARLDLLQEVIRKIGENATLFLIENGGHSYEVPKRTGRNSSIVWSEAQEAVLRWLKQFS